MADCQPNNVSAFNFATACDFINNVESCRLDSGFLNYFQWQYCSFNNRIAPSILMLIWFLCLLVAIASAAECFLTPCLIVVAKSLRMSENLAGVTLLAFGNGAADVFSSLSAIVSASNPNISLAFGAILGAGIIVNTLAAGIIIIIKPFSIMRRPIIKDLCFYFVGLVWIMIIFIRKKIEIWSSVVFLILYIIYILTTIVSRFLYTRKKKLKNNENQSPNNIEITITDPSGETMPDETTSEIINKIPQIKNLSSSRRFSLTSLYLSSVMRYFSRKRHRPNDIESQPTVKYESSKHEISLSFQQPTIEVPRGYDNLAYVKTGDDEHLSVPNGSIVNNPKMSLTINDSKLQHRSLSQRKENYEIHLNVPEEIKTSEPRTPSKLSYSSSIEEYPIRCSVKNRSLERSIIPRSHGSFIKTIIENEQQKLMKKFGIQPFNSSRKRSVSLMVSTNTPSKQRTRSQSLNKVSRATEDLYHNYSKVNEQTEMNLVENIKVRNDDLSENNVEELEQLRFPGKWRHLLMAITPLNVKEWKEQSKPERVMPILQIPFMILFTLTTPVVDENIYLNGWCKFLNCFHCLISLVIGVILTQKYSVKFGSSNFILVYLFIIFGVIFLVVVAATSKFDKPPVYHKLFAFLGLLISVLWIYEIANEIVNIITVFGAVLNVSDMILGLSVLAFANSVGDLVSNITLARKNYPRIGYTACIGGPLFNLLVGIGLPFSIRTAKEELAIDVTPTTITLIFTILIITVANIICLPLMKFQPKRIYGIVLIITLVIYIILVILFERKVINVKM